MLKGETSEYEMIFKNKEWNPDFKPNTPKEYPSLPYGYQANINILVNKRLNDRLLSHSGSSISGDGTKGGDGKIDDNRRQSNTECKNTGRSTQKMKMISGPNYLTRPGFL